MFRRRKRKRGEIEESMPASIENDAEVVATGIDVCAVHYITTVFDGCAKRWLGEVMGRR
jgi:hypothetical protein